MEIKGMNNALEWLNDMISLFSNNPITIPTDYRSKVLEVKKLLNNDISGVVSSLLDLGITASLVNYRIETENSNLNDLLNKEWLANINKEFMGEIPVGIRALAKEYFRERYKGSSFLLLRSVWEDVDGFILPTKMWFVDGEDIIVKNDEEGISLTNKKYYLRISQKKNKKLPINKQEKIFIQRPFSSWGTDYPVPFLIYRGIYKNLKLLELLEGKGEDVVSKALEYLFVLKKGTEGMAKLGRSDFIYDESDLRKVKENFQSLASDRKNNQGISTYVTNFDTELEHLIPEYSRALNGGLYEPILMRLLGGLGIVEIVQSIGANRREAVLNPRPFISMIEEGVKDFKSLLTDLSSTIIEVNKASHPKYFAKKIEVNSSILKDFLTDAIRDHIRSAYDRGDLSKRTYIESIENFDFDTEIKRRKEEFDRGYEELLYPHIIQNKEDKISPTEERRVDKIKNIDNPITEDKQKVEKQNFKSSVENGKEFEQAPYTEKNYPPQIKNLPKGARNIWIKSFNAVLESTGDEDKARMAAWRNVKLRYKRVGDKWVRKEKGELENSIKEMNIDDLIELKKLEILGRQSKIIDKILENNEE